MQCSPAKADWFPPFSDFYKGGKMIARIDFKSKESSDKKELQAK